jgi:prevent-host-death family protein
MSGNNKLTACVDIGQAKMHLSNLLDKVVEGSTVVICRAGKPVARLVPLEPVVRTKKLGILKGRIRVSDDFDAPLPPEALAGSS